jgi:hypothetical protein
MNTSEAPPQTDERVKWSTLDCVYYLESDRSRA